MAGKLILYLNFLPDISGITQIQRVAPTYLALRGVQAIVEAGVGPSDLVVLPRKQGENMPKKSLRIIFLTTKTRG
jgi:hypothetical protein